MEEASSMTKGRYKYVHDVKIGAPEAIDVHHIFISRSCANFLPLCSYALRLAAACFLIFALLQKTMSVYDLLMLDKPIAIVIWSFVVAGFLVRQILRNQVEKESVIILPAFGVQLERVYRSGETVHQFVPIDKILKHVLNECVTPVTCYWSLSLIICGKDELLLVFKPLTAKKGLTWLQIVTFDNARSCNRIFSGLKSLKHDAWISDAGTSKFLEDFWKDEDKDDLLVEKKINLLILGLQIKAIQSKSMHLNCNYDRMAESFVF